MLPRKDIRFLAVTVLILLGLVFVASIPTAAQGNSAPAAFQATETQDGDEQEEEFYDQAFIDYMVPNHQAAIQMMQLAVERSSRPELVQFLTVQIENAQLENQVMLDLREEWFGSAEVPPLTAIPVVPDTPEHQMGIQTVDVTPVLTQLQNLPDETFELVFLDVMIRAHGEAIEASLSTLNHADHARTYRLAQRMLIEHQRAADQLTMMRDQWYFNANTLPVYEPPITPTPLPTLTLEPTEEATVEPTDEATAEPTDEGTAEPIEEPTEEGTPEPTGVVTVEPTDLVEETPQ